MATLEVRLARSHHLSRLRLHGTGSAYHLREVSIGEKQKFQSSSSESESLKFLETQPAHWTESRRGLAHSTRLVGDKTDAVASW
jgi:hypothetical protein